MFKKVPKLEMIVAIDRNGCIGKDNGLPWEKHTQDMAWFRRNTFDRNIIMGRKTFQTLPTPYLKRRNIFVLSRNSSPCTQQFSEGQVNYIKTTADIPHDGIVAGGSEIYELLFDNVQTVYLTEMRSNYPCDAHLSLDIIEMIDSWTLTHYEDGNNCVFKTLKRTA